MTEGRGIARLCPETRISFDTLTLAYGTLTNPQRPTGGRRCTGFRAWLLGQSVGGDGVLLITGYGGAALKECGEWQQIY